MASCALTATCTASGSSCSSCARAADALPAGEAVDVGHPGVQVAVEAVAVVDASGRGRRAVGQQVPRLDARRATVRRQAHELAGLQLPEADEAAGGVVEIAERVRARPDARAHERAVALGAVHRDALVVAVAVDDEHGGGLEVRGLKGDRRVREVVADEAHLRHVLRGAAQAEVALQPRGRVLQAPLHAEQRRGQRDVPADRHELDIAGRRAGRAQAVLDGEHGTAARGVLGPAEALLLAERQQRPVALDEAGGRVVPAGRRGVDAEDHGGKPRTFGVRSLCRALSARCGSGRAAAPSGCPSGPSRSPRGGSGRARRSAPEPQAECAGGPRGA